MRGGYLGERRGLELGEGARGMGLLGERRGLELGKGARGRGC